MRVLLRSTPRRRRPCVNGTQDGQHFKSSRYKRYAVWCLQR